MRNLQNLLTEAVPELPAPPDRLAEVGARVRRRRRSVSAITVGLVVLATGAAVAVPSLLRSNTADRFGDDAPPVAVGADGCPVPSAYNPMTNKDRPGQLVPKGATEAALCMVPSTNPEWNVTRVLTTGVDELVRLLNDMPGTARYWQMIRERQISEGFPDPGPTPQIGCLAIAHKFSTTALRLRYADREPVFVFLSRNCGTASVGDKTRHWSGTDLLAIFFAKYRDQLATTTDSATINTPACGQTLATPFRWSPSEPVDGIELNREGTSVFLPNALAAATVCRYTVNNNVAQLTASKSQRGDLGSLRDAINRQFEIIAGRPRHELVNCYDYPHLPLQRMDVVRVADVTGAVSEIWLHRVPCPAANVEGRSGLVADTTLLSEVDVLLR
jgi:hypothetical protein